MVPNMMHIMDERDLVKQDKWWLKKLSKSQLRADLYKVTNHIYIDLKWLTVVGKIWWLYEQNEALAQGCDQLLSVIGGWSYLAGQISAQIRTQLTVEDEEKWLGYNWVVKERLVLLWMQFWSVLVFSQWRLPI